MHPMSDDLSKNQSKLTIPFKNRFIMKNTRREFIKTSASLTGLGVVAAGDLLAASSKRETKKTPSDQIRVALIGCRNQGYTNLTSMMRNDSSVVCAALVDVDGNVLNGRMADLQKEFPNNGKVEAYADYRKVLDDKSIDTVIIGTPDHWHCLQFVEACQAGKNILVEKPIANYMAEAEIMLAAAKKYNNIVCVNQHQRSGEEWIKAMEIVKSGILGKITRVDIWANFGYAVGGPIIADSPVPEGIDFDKWLGPAKKRTFNGQRYYGSWRMFWDYGGGLMTDWGVHLLDMGMWAMDAQGMMPNQVYSNGGRFAFLDRASETASTQTAIYQFDDWQMTWSQNGGVQEGPYGRLYGVAFIGTEGTLVADRDGYEVFPEWSNELKKRLFEPIPKFEGDRRSQDRHTAAFIKCIKEGNRNTPCTIQVGRDAALLAHMANISYRLGGAPLVYDANTQRFIDNDKANAMLFPKYRAPYQFPVI